MAPPILGVDPAAEGGGPLGQEHRDVWLRMYMHLAGITTTCLLLKNLSSDCTSTECLLVYMLSWDISLTWEFYAKVLLRTH